MKNQKGFAPILIVGLVLMILLVGGYAVYSVIHSKSKKASSASRPHVITNEQFSSAIDPSGAAVSPRKRFSAAEPKIYAVLTLNNAKAGSSLQYVRYLEGKYVDKGNLKITKDGANHASFIFIAQSGKPRPKGAYRVKVYTNGKYEGSAKYDIQ